MRYGHSSRQGKCTTHSFPCCRVSDSDLRSCGLTVAALVQVRLGTLTLLEGIMGMHVTVMVLGCSGDCRARSCD